MIPTLYEKTETAFTTNGLGKLPDFLSGKVTEARNGQYTLSGIYAATGKNAEELTEERIITAVPADGKAEQPFRISKVTRRTGGRYEIEANHLSYDLNGMVVMPFTATSVADAMVKIKANIVGNCPFTFWTCKEVTGTYTLRSPRPVREILGGSQGSLLDVYGTGEYEFDGLEVKLYLHRGSDRGVVIRSGKNLTSASAEISTDGVYTAIVPYWSNDATVVTLPEKVVESSHVGSIQRTKVVDFSSDFESPPTVAQLRERATQYLANNSGWELKENVKVGFVPLWQTEEYRDYAASIERVNLCDTVTVLHEALGITAEAKVIQTDYNFLKDRYESIEIGNAKRANLSEAISNTAEQTITQAAQDGGIMAEAIAKATSLLTGISGGNIKFHYNADGLPYEMLIMDEPDESTATHIWKYNYAGWGYSHDGGASYTTAATINGGIIADSIIAGTLRGLSIYNGDGTFAVDGAGNVVANSLTSSNATITGGGINIQTSSDTQDHIVLNSDKARAGLHTNGLTVENKSTAENPNRKCFVQGAAIGINDISGEAIKTLVYLSGRGDSGEVILRGSSGNYLARLGVGSDIGWLYLYDDAGTRRVALGNDGLYFFDASGNVTKRYTPT